jgi:SAM-dependent methyltransferase
VNNQFELEQRIAKYYTDIKPDKNYLDIYVVRKAIFDFIKQNLHNFSGDILDLGCGIMPYRNYIVRNVKCDNYIGIDFESSLNDEYSLVRPDLNWDGKKIPLPNNSIDVVLCTELLEHCSNANDILDEMYRVLKPNGKLMLTVPFLWNLHLVPYDEFRYTPFSLRRLLEQAGFCSVDLKALGTWDASLAQMLGIWYQQRPLKKRYLYFPFVKSAIKILLKKDSFHNKSDIYKEGLMITGICGISEKPYNSFV